MRIRLLALFFFCAGLPAASAQQARLLSSEGPYYTGVAVDLQIAAEGFSESPEPQIEAPPVADATLEFLGVSPSINTSIQIINGRMTQSKTVRFNFNYRFLATQPGSYRIGPFTVTQDGQQATSNTLTLTLGDIPRAANQHIELILPDKTIYVGQRVPLRIEWWAQANLQNRLYQHRLRLPLLFMRSDFRVEEAEIDHSNTRLVIETENGSEQLAAIGRADDFNGEPYIVIAAEFIITPLKAGDYETEPVSLSVDEVVRWRRNLFGDRVPSHAEKRRVESSPLKFTVAEVPQEGKPDNYAGAVGTGYSLEVSADRSVVQVGDPITLTLTLRGDETVAGLSLPAAEKLGLPASLFRLPSEEIAGDYRNGQKVFELPVRVLSDSVREIPPLSFAWFDPEQERYQSTQSQPIALSVGQAKIISAQDVVSGIPEQTPPAQTQSRAGQDGRGADSDGTGTGQAGKLPLTLTGAELSIERDIGKLTKPAGSWFGSPALQLFCYAVSGLLVLLACVLRRRAAQDPHIAARRQHLQQLSRSIANATTVSETAAGVRRMAAAADTFPREDFDLLLAECDARVYAPGGNSAPVEAPLKQRAMRFASAILESAR